MASSLSGSELQSENVVITLSLGYKIFDGVVSQAEASVVQVRSLTHLYFVSFQQSRISEKKVRFLQG